MSTLKVNAVIDASGGNTATINSMTPTADSLQGQRNRIINGDMRIDQRNAGASVTVASTGTFVVDRWEGVEDSDGVATAEQVQDVPSGFTDSIKWTTTTADASLSAAQFCRIGQVIEGYNTADFGWGSASAKTITLSFWVRSSLTGTFAGGLRNSAGDRSYVFTYSISAANTWEQKTVTVAGDTSGTWLTNNGRGVWLIFDLGSGSNFQKTANAWGAGNCWSTSGAVSVIGTLNATWFITGVQLEVGSVATPFERRDYGRELMLCQRYYEKSYDQSVVPGTASNDSGCQTEYLNLSTTGAGGAIRFTVTKRGTPTVTSYSTNSGTSGKVYMRSQGVDVTPSIDLIGQTGARMTYTQSSGIVNTTYHWVSSSEL
jgi:hypothetical protein